MGDRGGFLALRWDWVAGDPKHKDRDLTRLAALALNVRAVEAVHRGDAAPVDRLAIAQRTAGGP